MPNQCKTETYEFKTVVAANVIVAKLNAPTEPLNRL